MLRITLLWPAHPVTYTNLAALNAWTLRVARLCHSSTQGRMSGQNIFASKGSGLQVSLLLAEPQ